MNVTLNEDFGDNMMDNGHDYERSTKPTVTFRILEDPFEDFHDCDDDG